MAKAGIVARMSVERPGPIERIAFNPRRFSAAC
jgi:hypothetical protein